MTMPRFLLPVVLPAFFAAALYAPANVVNPRQAAQTPGPRPMTLLDIVSVPRITDAQLSPDGRSVSYNLGRSDWKANRTITHLWEQPVAGGPPVQLTNGAAGESSARWSPDSKTLLYGAGGQIYLISADGGTPRQLTRHATSIQASPSPMTMPTWSPDGSSIYFVAADPRVDALPAAANSGNASYVSNVSIFGQTESTQQHLWKVSVASGVEERITSGDWSVHAFRLSSDGRRFAILRAPTTAAIDHYRSEVWVMDVDGGNGRALTNNGLYEVDAALSPDNSQMLFLVDANEKLEAYYGQALFVVPASGGPALMLPPIGHSVETAAWAPDGRSILAVVNLGVRQEIYRVDVAAKTARALTDGSHTVLGLNLVPSAGRMIFQLDEPTRLGDAWTLPLDGGSMTRVTGIYDNLATEFALPRQEKVSWKGADGVTIEGLLFYPVGYRQGQRYPLVVQLHGGPVDSDKFGFGPAVLFNYVPVLAAKGYAVLRPNYRGSSGYGSAFMRDIIGHYFNNMHLDVMAGIDALIKQGIVDPDRLAVMGTSAGAHIVNKLITFTPRFKAASSTAGVANWISLMAQTDAVTRRTFWMGGTPWQKDAPTDLLWNNSPVKDVWKVKTPTLFVAGGRDTRVPKEQALEMYRGLESIGVPTKLIIGNNEDHQWRELASQFYKDNTELEWFEKYVMNRPYTPEVPPVEAPAAR